MYSHEGWHKRYFVLEKGVLSYGKSTYDLKQRGRTHGKINLGDAVISAKTEGLRIDINDEFIIHHLKVHQETDFLQWVEQLQQHKLYQNQVGELRHVLHHFSVGN